jgi:tetratricopeptide (TPR) repeat protein
LLDTYGPAPFKAAYADADLAGAYGQPLERLVRGWEGFLDGLPLPKGARELARERFDRQGVFMRVCPLEIPRLEAEAGRQAAAGDLEAALATARRVVGFVPGEPRKRIAVVALLAKQGQPDAAAAEAKEVLAMGGAATATRAYVQELVADALWRAGRLDEALAAYRPAVALAQSEDRERTVAVKIAILERREREPILGPYLLGGGAGDDAIDYLTGALADLPGDPLALYLLGRRLGQRERHAEAAQVLSGAIEGYAGDASEGAALVRREAWRLLGQALFFSDQLAAAQRAFTRAAAEAVDAGDRLSQRDWAARAAWVVARREAGKN